MRTEFNKLVRDNIPDIISSHGETPITRTLDVDEYIHCLEEKLDEEVAEFHRDHTPEELADILEVVFALADATGCSRDELFSIYDQKHNTRGGFEKRCFLIAKE